MGPPEPATLPLGMARNTNTVIDPSIPPTVGKCYAFWSDDENLDIARHDPAKPNESSNSIEFRDRLRNGVFD